jgi:predicted nuclease of predicted toxin-antitoxin system
MRLLCDQDVYYITEELLRKWGHDVVTARELDMSRAEDEELLIRAAEMKRIFVTRDKDFGALVFLKQIQTGVILLKMRPATNEKVHQNLYDLLLYNTENKLLKLFSIVESSRYRLRKII